MNKRSGASINIGTSSILVIFVLLCLTTFSTLSVLSANADMRLTRKAEAASNQFWAANNRAQEALAEVDALLTIAYSESTDAESYSRAALALLSSFGSADLAFFTGPGGTDFVCYTVPLGDAQELYVELELDYSAGHFLKKAWQTRSIVDWNEYEDTLDLWDGGHLA